MTHYKFALRGSYPVLAAAALALVLPLPAYAQLDQQTGIADPGRQQEQFRDSLTHTELSPDIEVKELALQGAPPGAENIHFVLQELEVEGFEAYSDAQLRPLYADKIGTEISLADLYDIANQITLKYRNDGYLLTQVVVPPQTIDNGYAQVRVVEGYVNNVIVQGNATHDGDVIHKYASRINTGHALNIRELERQLLLINDLPGITARSVLSPSADTPGAAEMLIIVDNRDPYDGLLEINNFGSRYLGPINLVSSNTFNGWLGMNEAITAQLVIAPDSGYELAFGALGYEQPIGPYGTKASAYISATDTDPGYDLAQFDVRGHSNLYSVKVTHPFIRARSQNLTTRLLFDWRDVRSSNNIEPTREDNLRVLRAGARYEFLDTLLGIGFNAIDIEISKGLSVFGASDEGDANLTRDEGDPQFLKANIEIQRLQRLTNSFNLLLAASGQVSNDPLLSSEEFGVGGTEFGRAFDSSEVVGDDGIAAKAELQWNNPMNIEGGNLEKFQAYTFYDAGRVWNEDATTSTLKTDTITSAGAGVRANFPGNTSAGFAVAFPLNRDVQTQNDRDPRAYFNLTKKF
ncbi:MAG: ShlB/FhaC/HecB family hemolysin secretion/activation protein [Alphaproteobacteria bacterium]